MASLDVETMMARFERAWSTRDQWQGIYQDAYEYTLPNRNLYTTTQAGAKKQDKIFDSTGVQALSRFASRMQSDLTPPFERWIQLEAGPAVPENQKQQLNSQLQADTDTMHNVLDASSFATAVSEFFHDLGIGTGIMMVLEGDDRAPIHFIPVPIAQVALEEGPHGLIDGIYRKHCMKKRLITQTWPDAKLPEDYIKTGADNEKENGKEVDLIECTYYDPVENIWRYDVLLKKEKERIVERSYKTNPFIVTRWMKVAGEVFGRGPAVLALPDIKTLNKAVEMSLKNAALAIAAPWLVSDDGITNPDTIRIAPNALIRVARTGGSTGASIVPLETGRNFDIADFVVEDLRMQIKKMLFDDQLPPLEGSVRSATEIMQRVRELANEIGSAFGRLMHEFVQPFVRRVVQILSDLGYMQTPYQIINQLAVKVSVVSPIAKAQRLSDVQNVVQWLEILMTLLGQQAVMTAVKVEDLAKWMGEKLGVPSQLVRTDGERKQKEREMAQVVALENARNQPAAADQARGGGQQPMARAA